MRTGDNEHTSLDKLAFDKDTKTIIDRYIFTIGKIYKKKVLDFGCGCGHGMGLMAAYGATEVCGYDISKAAIKEAKANLSSNKIKFVDDLKSIPKNSFDVITAFEVIEHIEKKELKKIMQTLKRILKPSGIFIMSSPINKGESDDEFHVNEMSNREFLRWASDTFKEWKLYSTVEFITTQGICALTDVVEGIVEQSRCFLIVGKNDK